MMPARSLALLLPLLVAPLAVTLAPDAAAQTVARRYYENPPNGFKFKPLEDFTGVPVQAGREGAGLVTQMTDAGNEIWVYAIYDPKGEESEEGRSTAGKRRADIADVLARSLNGFNEKMAKEPLEDETARVKKIEARRRTWEIKSQFSSWQVTAWTFPLTHADVSMVYLTDLDRYDKKWERAITKSAKTFTEIERETFEFEGGEGEMTYDQQLAKAEFEASATPGWRAVATPSKKFIIVTSCEKDDFVDEVIKRLEASREVFEKDFPPPPGFDAVSIVRICATEEEFHKYGGTGGGVAGWFSPTTTELVLFDNVANNRNSTYAVATHEAFHQYCHFLFHESEAHRWFDEGHGDYYGGMELKGSRMVVTRMMPGGLDRLTVIRQMLREETYKPIVDHVNYDHQQWQSQGPSNVSCYAQSWSLIYFLRQGTEGKVSRKVWKKEYADIIPNYVNALKEGYVAAYDEILEQRRERAKRKGEDPEAIDTRVGRQHLWAFDPRRKEKIWEKAMEASWGQIDMEQFEADWVEFVDKHL